MENLKRMPCKKVVAVLLSFILLVSPMNSLTIAATSGDDVSYQPTSGDTAADYSSQESSSQEPAVSEGTDGDVPVEEPATTGNDEPLENESEEPSTDGIEELPPVEGNDAPTYEGEESGNEDATPDEEYTTEEFPTEEPPTVEEEYVTDEEAPTQEEEYSTSEEEYPTEDATEEDATEEDATEDSTDEATDEEPTEEDELLLGGNMFGSAPPTVEFWANGQLFYVAFAFGGMVVEPALDRYMHAAYFPADAIGFRGWYGGGGNI